MVFYRSIFIIIISFLFISCTNEEKTYKPTYSNEPLQIVKKEYIFGIHPLHNPKRLFEVYQPLVDYLNKNLKGIEIKLEASRNYAAFNKKLFSGYYDFALPNPYQTIQSLKYGYRVFGKMGDDNNFRGIILVRKDSNIKSLNDLKNKTVSYPAPSALAATMMPQYFMYKNGININKDIQNSYVGSQESSIMNVYLKKSIAASTWPPPWFAFIKERPEIAKEVEIKWETKPLLNNGLVVKKSIDANEVKKIAYLIFNLHKNVEGKDILRPMELSKFEEANEQTYKIVEEFLEDFEKNVRSVKSKK